MQTAILKTQVEETFSRMKSSNPLLTLARTGQLTEQQFRDYLNNLMYFFTHSVIHLQIARKRAAAMGLQEILPFLEEKSREEQGHDRWAQNDLAASGSSQDGVDLGRVAPATHRMLAYSVDLIERDPELFLAYMFFHEYITVVGGPVLLDDLAKQCGIEAGRVTAVAHHVALDRRHVDEDLEELEKVVRRTPFKLRHLETTVRETSALADAFYAGSVSLFH